MLARTAARPVTALCARALASKSRLGMSLSAQAVPALPAGHPLGIFPVKPLHNHISYIPQPQKVAPVVCPAGVLSSSASLFSTVAPLPNVRQPVANGFVYTSTAVTVNNAAVTGSGLMLLEADNHLGTPCVVLFHNLERGVWEEAGGYIKDGHDVVQSALQELYEESCTLIDADHLSVMPMAVDIHGRSQATKYRCFFALVARMNVDAASTFVERRNGIVSSALEHFDLGYRETDGIVRVPLNNITLNADGSVHAVDCDGNALALSDRTMKILAQGGLDFLRIVTAEPQAVAEAESEKLMVSAMF